MIPAKRHNISGALSAKTHKLLQTGMQHITHTLAIMRRLTVQLSRHRVAYLKQRANDASDAITLNKRPNSGQHVVIL